MSEEKKNTFSSMLAPSVGQAGEQQAHVIHIFFTVICHYTEEWRVDKGREKLKT